MKKKVILILMIFLSIVLVIMIYFNYFKEQKIAILTYHNVIEKVENKNGVDISVDYFDKQMKWLFNNGYKTITLDEFYDWKKGKVKLPNKSVVITFDDGWESIYSKVIPILEKYNFKATVFVIWGEHKKYNNFEYLSKNQIEDIESNYPNIKLESHSFALHRHEEAYSKDYNLYTKDIEIVNEINRNVKYYAYPFGIYNNEYKKALKDNNYKLAFTFGPYDFAGKSDDDFTIPRWGVFENTPFWKFKLKLMLLFTVK